MSRPIPETHESRLKKVLDIVTPHGEIDESNPLPEAVQALYWQCEKIARKFGSGGVSDDVLLFIAVMSGAYEVVEEPSFLETAKVLDRGEDLEVSWRGSWVPATFLAIKGKLIQVKVLDDAETQREFLPSEVRLPLAVTSS